MCISIGEKTEQESPLPVSLIYTYLLFVSLIEMHVLSRDAWFLFKWLQNVFPLFWSAH